MATRARAVGLGCMRGTMLALVSEGGVALGVYAIWYLLRLLH